MDNSMEWFSAEFFTALLSIIMIDLVLAGDNAIVIGLAARNVPKELQKKVVLWGTVGAIGIRIVATVAVTFLLKIPGLLLLGGLMLIWIAYKLLVDKKEHDIAAKNTVGAAVGTIIVADAAMGFDNVIAVAGAAESHIGLVIIGLLITVPIVVWGSTLFIKLIDRYPVIIYAGSAVLAFTASKMIMDEPFIHKFFENNPVLKYSVMAIIILAVLVLGRINAPKAKPQGS